MADERWHIAVTGIGLVTPLGLNSSETVARALRGDSAASVRSAADGAYAEARVPAFDLSTLLRAPKNLKLIGHPVRMALLAAREAVAQSGFGSGFDESERVGVYMGSGQTGLEYDEFFKALFIAWEKGREQDFKYLGAMPTRLIDRYFSLRTLSNAGIAHLSTEFGARGPSNNFVQGEIAPAAAIYCACHDLMEGRADVVMVGGYDALLIPSQILAFRKVGLLSAHGDGVFCRPFDRNRDGLVLAEGAACLILEKSDTARARGAEVLAEINGVGLASQVLDESGFTAPSDVIRRAVFEAAPMTEFDFIVARGLATVDDDLAEGAALAEFADPDALITALKGQTGYLGAATSAVELGIGLLSARLGLVPPVGGLIDPDPRIPLNFVRDSAAALPLPNARGLFLSSTFGGQVAAIAAQASPPASA